MPELKEPTEQEINNPDLIKEKIIAKFTSLNRFANISGLEIQSLNRLLKSRVTRKRNEWERTLLLKEVFFKMQIFDNILASDLTPELTQTLKDAIISKYGQIKAFCKEHKEFYSSEISEMLRYDGKYKRITPKVELLAKILKVKLNDKRRN